MNLQRHQTVTQNEPAIEKIQSGPLILVENLKEIVRLINEDSTLDPQGKWDKINEMLIDDDVDIYPEDSCETAELITGTGEALSNLTIFS